MRTFNWSGYEWITQERWGQINPGKLTQWYDESAVIVDSATDYLELKTQYNPKYFAESPDGPGDPNFPVTSPMGIGLVSCTTRFTYGTFEIEARLPEGKHLWPAFWMWSWNSWPPEIDVFEGYTDSREGYYDEGTAGYIGEPQVPSTTTTPIRTANWKVLWNVHWRDQFNQPTSLGGVRGVLPYKDPTKHFIKYKAVWKPLEILIYFDDVLTATFTNSVVMSQYIGTRMNVIINNAIQPEMDLNNPTLSSMFIKYFTYTPL